MACWFFSFAPQFPSADIWLWLGEQRVKLEVSAELGPGWLVVVIRGVSLSQASSPGRIHTGSQYHMQHRVEIGAWLGGEGKLGGFRCPQIPLQVCPHRYVQSISAFSDFLCHKPTDSWLIWNIVLWISHSLSFKMSHNLKLLLRTRFHLSLQKNIRLCYSLLVSPSLFTSQ